MGTLYNLPDGQKHASSQLSTDGHGGTTTELDGTREIGDDSKGKARGLVWQLTRVLQEGSARASVAGW